ncbi:hypothetical protein E0H26_02210 [Micromonospora zingiberis]|uniref:Uncharacterized protein n=1 Tax=Micromonospora zingiberis TaxID=2053011 RepID=A0A4R0GYF6_9ACTN|nr:hypothetical protein [Micromonospora zingiberis]TCC00519.1 hypothetical protein E0H26_02210 [Micromonospora zingiberis]
MTDPQLIAAVVEESAEQDVPGFRKKRDLCRQFLLNDQAVYHVAHYTGGVLDFSLDLLAHESAPAGRPDTEPAQRREAYRRVGAQLVYRAADLNRRVWHLQCGGLVRLAIQTRVDFVFCNATVGGEHVVGFAKTSPATDAVVNPATASRTDQGAAKLASDLRGLTRQPAQNLGGWLTEEYDQSASAGEDIAPYLTGVADRDGILARSLRSAGLHYLSHHRLGEQVAAVDILGHPDLEQFFSRGATVVDRRIGYERLARDLSLLALQVSRDLRRVITGEVERLVLDVEIGAVYYYLLAPDDYLFGVCLDQDWVSHADQAMWRVGAQLSAARS